MGQPIVHFEIIGKDAEKLRSYYGDFPESSTEVKEHFAQVGAYTAILDLKDANLEGAMLRLSKNQSLKYRFWEAHRALVQAGVNAYGAKLAFQNQLLTLLRWLPASRQVPRREHLHCYANDD